MKTIYGFLVILLVFSSCRSYKDFDVMRNMRGATLNSSTQTKYIIKPNDNLFISILTADPELNENYNPAQAGLQQFAAQAYDNLEGQYIYGYEVDAEGMVFLPLIGQVEVGGLDLKQARDSVKTAALEYLRDVSVKVKLLNYKVTVIGEVEAPGVYFNYNSEFTIMDAISSAGGFTDFADLNNVKVIRPLEDGKEQVYYLDVQEESALLSQAYYITPNDIVIVPPGKNKNIALKAPAITLGLATITTALLLVNVLR